MSGHPSAALDRPIAAPAARDRGLERAALIARLMDERYLDPILGFVLPGAGDLISAGLGLYAVSEAWRRRAPRALVARMLLNLSVDLLGGMIPIVGDIWDFFFKAHSRNLALLRSRLAAGPDLHADRRSRWLDGLVVAGAGLVFVAALAAPVVALVLLVRALR